MKKVFYKWIFFRLMNWKIIGQFDPEIKKSVLMVMPHTSWHDFYIGLLTRGIIGLEMHFVAKRELFRMPFGWYFRYMGGSPLDRTGGRNKVDSIASIFHDRDVFRMAIAPEGTRKKVREIKTGFYFIALKAGVPIIPVAFDYGTRAVSIGNPFYPSGNLKADLPVLLEHFSGVTGKIRGNEFNAAVYLSS